jgi:RNA polymerase sigma-70 factor (ECF subfamily)
MARVLHAALEEVGEDAREAFVLHELEGMTLQQIAELTGNSINTIAARVRRTRERVAQILTAATRLQAVGGGLR